MNILNPSALEQLLKKFADIDRKLAEPIETQEIIRLSKERAELEPVVTSIHTLQKTQKEIADLKTLLNDKATDQEMRTMAEDELADQTEALEQITQQLKLQLIPKDVMDDRNVILEVRAGTGGDEASLFAGDLFRMYERYASTKGWRVEIMSQSEGTVGGYKEVIANITGDGVFSRLKFESGVHRVQRVPDTETEGRVHTSAATVAVLPEAEEVDIEINMNDLKIDTYRASGAGGQHVNTTDSAIRITHIPTGIVVTQQDERSQHKNKAAALKILRAKIYTAEQDRLNKERASARKTQVGSGDRSERIRTYNYPQGRVSDHRINLTLYKLPEIMEGTALDDVIDPLVIDHQTKMLSALDENGA